MCDYVCGLSALSIFDLCLLAFGVTCVWASGGDNSHNATLMWLGIASLLLVIFLSILIIVIVWYHRYKKKNKLQPSARRI